jgi:hypothetical protein
MRHLVAFLCAAILACSAPAEAPWLTATTVDEHAKFLPLAATPHDPTTPGAAVSCDGCHPGTTFTQFVCTTCHGPAATDPLHMGVAGYAPGGVTSAQCLGCHPQGQGLAPADHATFFPIATPAHPAVCTLCHTDRAARQDPSTLACVACHSSRPGFSTAHAAVKDCPVAPPPEWCLRCHADSQVDRIAAHGPQAGPSGNAGPGDGRHDTHCFQCHTMVPPLALFGGTGAGVASRPWAQDWKQAACTKCH